LSRLSLEKELANRNAINTSSDVDNLISLANAASATTASVTKLTHAKTILAQAEKLQRDIAFGNSTVSLKEVTKLRIEADNLLKEAIKYQTFNPNTFKYTGASTSNKTDSSKDKEDTWFDKEYAKHQHLVAMDKETQKDYLKWLDSAYQKAYKEGIIELDDYYKYREEVYEGLRELFKEYLSDTEHEISLRENYDGEAANILKLYKKLISDVEKELTTAKKQGLDDTDEYIQELQDKWQDYVDACKEMEEEAIESAKDAVDELVEYRIDMIKQDIEDEKDALDKKLDNLKEFYDKQKDMLQDKYDEEKYLEEQAEKRKTVSDLQAELKMLEKDDSAWAQKRKLELKEELSTAEKDLKDFEKDKALDLALDALDKAYESQESQIQAEMDALEERLNDPHALYNQALSEIRENTGGLYDEMIEYNRKYGTGNDEDIKETYEEAYKVLLGYKDLFGEENQGNTPYHYKPQGGNQNLSSGATDFLGIIKENQARKI
jgi:chromosome segregation ATPase